MTGDGVTSGVAGPRRSIRVKAGLVVAAVAVTALVGAVAFSMGRDAATRSAAAVPAASSRVAAPPKPAFTRAEEAYIQALWPIHGEVERTTIRMSLGKIFYKSNELGREDLKARVDAALATYRRCEARLAALQPPPSLALAHEDYLSAIRSFEQATIEAAKMFDDGNDAHLVAAYPFSLEGSNKIRELGVRFWQDEFPAN